MSSMLAAASSPSPSPSPQEQDAPQPPLAPPQVGAQPFLANAGIGNRPTLLTVSLVYDESGEASAFHVALIPRNTGSTAEGGEAGFVARGQRSSTEYDAEAPGVIAKKAGQDLSQVGSVGDASVAEVEEEAAAATAATRAGKRGPPWGAAAARGQNKSQKRRAAQR